jgi:hypothetical protein
MGLSFIVRVALFRKNLKRNGINDAYVHDGRGNHPGPVHECRFFSADGGCIFYIRSNGADEHQAVADDRGGGHNGVRDTVERRRYDTNHHR